MNTLPQAFKTRRVKETLVALSQHVETAITLARLEPVQTSEPELTGDILHDLPVVTLIELGNIDGDWMKSPISYQDRTTINSIKVTGGYLDPDGEWKGALDAVSEVYLIRIGEVGPWVASGGAISPILTNDVITALTAPIAVTNAPHGHYNLLLIDTYGQTALVRNAFTIRPRTYRPLAQPASPTAFRARSKAKAKKD